MNKNAKDTMRAFAAFAPDRIEEISLPIPEPDDYEALLDKVAKEFKDSENN